MAAWFILVFFIILFIIACIEPDDPLFLNPEYTFYSCHMENRYMRTVFIFRAKTEDRLVEKIKRQESYGWYYDGYLKRIDMQRAKELIDVGARIVY